MLEDEPQFRHRLVLRGMFAGGAKVQGDPVAEALAELRAERAQHLDKLIEEINS